jgi:hypothetical protein
MYNNAQSIKPMTISIINTIPPPAAPMAIAIVKSCEEFPEGLIEFVGENDVAADDGDKNLLVRVVVIDKDDLILLIEETRLLDFPLVTVVKDGSLASAADVLTVVAEASIFE